MYDGPDTVGNFMNRESRTLIFAVSELCLILGEPISTTGTPDEPEVRIFIIQHVTFSTEDASYN